MILLRGELGRITFDVSSIVQEYNYAHLTPSPLPPNKYEKLHNLDFGTFSKLINWKKITWHWVILTIFDSKHVIPYGRFHDNCVHALYSGRKFK